MTREQGTGNREQGRERRGFGQLYFSLLMRFWTTLLFVTYVGFFPFTYL
ncbi:hypothetical protein PN451_19815 [Dolichospermum planctonicum CS-1226]|uniref:Uncharacterized protein n=1 Tax=Dolichospermum planctonicum CS-1226 TaxID=3021751 RepID=A0ABT5AL65_9CYAN|nr:hypothetical protein [Dolichospermum planctonicum CS-1226]